MSIIPLSIDNFENYVIKTHTHRTFSSSSAGHAGELRVFPRGSDIEKDIVPPGDNTASSAVNQSLERERHDLLYSASLRTNISAIVDNYLNEINDAESSRSKQKRVAVIRFEPSSKYTKDTGRKNTVKQVLFPYYSNLYRSCDWAYPNYHSINFFTSSDVPSSSALIYPAPSGRFLPQGPFTFEFWINPRYSTDNVSAAFRAGTILHRSSSYAISLVSGTSVDVDGKPDAFRIMLQLGHSTGISPSNISLENPRGAPISGTSSDLVFLSSNNCIKKNHWHHVAIRWGGSDVSRGSGSFIIDGQIDENFCIPSSSISSIGDSALFVGNFFEQKSDSGLVTRFFNANTAYADGLESYFPSVPPAGLNYVDLNNVTPAGTSPDVDLTAKITFKNIPFPGTEVEFTYGPAASPQLTTIEFVNTTAGAHQIDVTGLSSTKDCATALKNKINSLFSSQGFFTSVSSTNVVTITGFRRPSGVINPIVPEIDCFEPSSIEGGDDPTITDPSDSSFALNHPLNAEIHEIKIYESYRDINSIISGSQRGISSISDDLLFYLPPYFTKTTNERNVLQTPFQATRSTTNDPFNAALSFGIGGREINLPNFLREFVHGTFPRLYHLTASEVAYTVGEPRSANDILYDNPGLRKGNLTILPNDNGQFFPDYTLLASDPANSDRFVNRFGDVDYSYINLDNMVSLTNIALGTATDDDVAGFLLGSIATPEDPGLAPGNILTILNRTRDPSSNEVVFFDASNLYYGNSIKQGTYDLYDSNLEGSGGKVSMRLRDNSLGGLYRADCLTAHATWNEVGALLYDEGIGVIKSPNIPFFGMNQWDLEFDGDYNVHVLEINVPCAKGMMNSSSNPNWQKMLPSSDANVAEDRFCYITGLNLHDENFNVVARMNLAQPVVKKDSDKFLFRLKIDF